MTNLITVESFTDPIDAHLAKGRLEAEGIPAFIAHENHIWANWMISHAIGGVKIQVAESNLETARLILQQHLNGEFEHSLVHEFDELEIDSCPNCGATEYASSPSLASKILLIISFGLLGVIYKIRKNHHKCNKCDHKWTD